MHSISTLTAGAQLNNSELCEIFKCGPQGGMRKSNKTNTLVIVSNHVESIYDDRWIGGVLHYTGMGQNGDQSLDFHQNKTLNESRENGVHVHLFEVHAPQVYTYVGEVELAEKPYPEKQDDSTGKSRKVWVFPVKTKSGEIPAVPEEVAKELRIRRERHAKRLSDAALAEMAQKSGRINVGSRSTVVQQHQRSIYVAEYAKRRARGICELCKDPAPFQDKSGQPYLETHHVVWLARGGEDTIRNTVALCPNCHKRMHVLDSAADVKRLRERV